MARIKIEDLPKDMKISKEEMKKVVGGVAIFPAASKDGGYTCGDVDVCKTPAPPAPFVPIPYPNITTSGDTTKDPVDTKITTATKPY